MSASLSGNFPLTSTGSSARRQRRPSASGLSYSSPDVPQLHAMPTRQESPQTHPPQVGPYLHSHHGHNQPGAGGGSVGGLAPLTPISNPSTGGSASPSGPASSTLSLTSISSSSTSHTTATGISRASSVRSTSSVQAVPMRKPQRGPVVPRIVTRGINALGAYGVSVPNNAQSPTRSTQGPTSPLGRGKGRDERTTAAERPGLPGRASWRRRKGDGIVSTHDPFPSPVHEGGSASPSSPRPPALPDGGDEGRTVGTCLDSPARAEFPPLRSGAGEEGWIRPRYNRADSSRMDDAVRIRQPSNSTTISSGGSDRGGGLRRGGRDSVGGSLSPPRSPSTVVYPGPPVQHVREASSASGSTAAPNSPRSPRLGRAGPDWGVVGEAGQRESGSPSGERTAPLIGMVPNAMGVVGNRRSTEDFEFGEVLGEGSYSTVTHVTTVHPPYRQYALKVLDKEHIKRERKTKYVLIERDTLKALDGHPGIVKLWWTFQDEWSLYYVLEFAQNGELLQWIKKYGSFDLRSARFYVAQILSAVGYMHEKGVIHRDLKPENILLDEHMRVKITDFGTAKLLKQEEIRDGRPIDDLQGRPRARSFVGTPEYVSPEILSEGRESSFSSDFWALGCILYQLLGGRPPFQARTEYLMFQKIINLEYEFPLGFPADAKDLVEKLLVVDPKVRLGGDPTVGNGIEAIKAHVFFTSHIPPRAPSRDDLAAADSALPAAPIGSVSSSLPPDQSTTSDYPSLNTSASTTAGNELDEGGTADLVHSFSSATLDTPTGTPPAHNTPRPFDHSSCYPFGVPEHPLNASVDWSTIWTIEPPQIHTGLRAPAPTIRGEFALLGADDSSSLAALIGTGLSGQASWNGSNEAGTREKMAPSLGDDEEEDVWEEGGDDRGSISDEYADPGSPTSTNGQELPLSSTFGGGKWSILLLPSETILLCSSILQRPSAAKTALLRSNRLKFSPRSLLSTSSSSSASPGASPHNGTMPLPEPSPPINPNNGLLTSGGPLPSIVRPSPHAGWKPRTLLLTDYPRLLCVKETSEKLSVKAEVFLGAALRGGVRRDGVSAFIAVESRGNEGKEFVVRTSSRSLKFAEPHGQALRWIYELQEAHRAGLTSNVRR